MAEMAVESNVVDAAGPYDRAKALSAFKLGDLTFYWITRLSAISVLLILGGIIISLIVGAFPAMKEYGLAFLWTGSSGVSRCSRRKVLEAIGSSPSAIRSIPSRTRLAAKMDLHSVLAE